MLSSSEKSTLEIGGSIAKHSFPGLVFLLEGELGAGKTVLVRGYCRSLGFSGVRSPSFTLVNHYRCGERSVVHCDLYRLSTVDPTELDIESILDGDSVLFVEWADRGLPFDFEESWSIRFRYGEEEGQRILSFRAEGARAKKALKAFFSAPEESTE